MDKSWWSLEEIFELRPIGEDAGVVEDNILDVGIGLNDHVWRPERLHVLDDLTDLQLHDDPEDEEGLSKIEQYTQALLAGETFPPMLGQRGNDGLVGLHDGRHRYNAYLAAGLSWAPVWVATRRPELAHERPRV